MVKGLGKFALGGACSLFYVFVAWRLWDWFAVPLGAPHLSYVHAFGLYALCSSILLWSFWISPDIDEEHSWLIVAAKILIAAVTLLEGFIAHSIMVAS